MSEHRGRVAILGIFVADTAYRADRQPKMGETILGKGFALGPGGKGSNQAVAVARLGSPVSFISRVGDDAFAKMAREMWVAEGVSPLVESDPNSFTGAAYIFIDDESGDNAIIVVPGAARDISPEDLERNRASIESATIFLTQLETPVEAAKRGLEIARSAGVTTILNPAPAADLETSILELCDYLVPNESEAELLTGIKVCDLKAAKDAAAELKKRGAKSVIVTLGENGALLYDGLNAVHVPPFSAGDVIETTGAGDCFCGAFAHALNQGFSALESTKFACAAASISVTRPGTAPSMPHRNEVDRLYRESLD